MEGPDSMNSSDVFDPDILTTAGLLLKLIKS